MTDAKVNATSAKILDLKEVSSGYNGTTILSHISFHVEEGEFFSIVGSNGAGKSTLLRTISGTLRLREGEIRFGGKSTVGRDPADVVREYRIAHVPEGRLLFPRMTVHQNLMLGAFTLGDRKRKEERLAYVLELFPRLAERRHQLAGTLSGGEQQMCAIARGLMLEPRLLMLDEPSLGVQPNIVGRIYETLEKINKKDGIAVLLVEQDIHHSLRMADRACVIQTGRIVMEGRGSELLGSDLVRRAYLGL
ncbi:MAG: ABC transporter ATP-binding protein [Synergistaceae bacterium]|jgi:branched-chain amino acid transport system ATP-binding protein|nr:ABC transporter ATP-binding protein [Synergistaceae bacterium]